MDVDVPSDSFDLSNLADLEQQQVCSLRTYLNKKEGPEHCSGFTISGIKTAMRMGGYTG